MPTGEEVDAGIKNLKTWWEVKGEWLKDDDLEGVMVGSLIAGKNNIKIGDTISVKGTNETKKLTVRGIINSGGNDDEAIYTVLKTTQDLFSLEDKITMIEVFIVTSVIMLRERTSGTLERIFTTPLTRLNLLVSYACVFGLLAVLQSSILVVLLLGPLEIELTSPA